nr:hypothetical protein [Tanacetum cinerariifolium]
MINMLTWALHTVVPNAKASTGNFKRLRLQDIEDMLLLLVQKRLTNLTIDERYDLNVALRMYTRRIAIQRRKRLMRADELYKFSDGTLNDVRSALHDIAMGKRMECLSMRKWINLDKKRARVMVQNIDKQLNIKASTTMLRLVGIEKVAVCSSL